MYVNLNINELVLLLRDRSELMDLLTGGLTGEKPYYEQQPPYAYIESRVLPHRNIFVRNLISFTVVLGTDGTDEEFQEIITVLDNLILSDVDGCLPIKQIGDVILTGISKGPTVQKFRHSEKGNLILTQDYYFDASTVN